jgi:hypothetical protein
MKISFLLGIAHLTTENIGLEDLRSQCDNQIQTLQDINMDELGLKGAAYTAIWYRLLARLGLLRAQRLAFDAILDANKTNITKLQVLPSAPEKGVLDTDWCQAKIDEASDARLHAIYSRLYIEQNYSFDSYPNRDADIRAWNAKAAGQQAIINYYQSLIDAANAYDLESASLYADAQTKVSTTLAQCNDAAQSCIDTGNYGAATSLIELGTQSLRIGEGIRQKVDAARAYMTDEELAAYILALLSDGVVDTDDIYAQGYFNDVLYSGLVKLPNELVSDAEVSCIAGAYNNMWQDNNIDAVDRMIEISYLKDPNFYASKQDLSPGSDIVIDSSTCLFDVYSQSPLLGRVAKAVIASMGAVEKGDTHYYDLLAGADIINTLAKDGHLIITNNMDVKILPIRSSANDGTFTTLVFNSELPAYTEFNIHDRSTRGTIHADVTNPNLYSATGEINSVCTMIDGLKNKNATAGYGILGTGDTFVADELFSYTAGLFPYVGDALSIGVDIYSNYVESMKEAENAKVIQDNSLEKVGAYAPLFGVLSECGFGLSVVADGSSTSSTFLAPNANVYISNNAAQKLGDLIDTFKEVKTPPFDNNLYVGSYDTSEFVKDLQTDLTKTIYPYDQNNPNNTARFLEWTEAYASTPTEQNQKDRDCGYPLSPPPGWELVYKEDQCNNSGEIINAAGTPVIRFVDFAIDPHGVNPIKNYEFFIGQGEGGDCSNYVYKKDYIESKGTQ